MTRTFPSGAVASPHHLASAVGVQVLDEGGNAVDAAIATNLVLSVVTPYHCGVGGDLFALVWDGQVHAIDSAGRAPAGATPDAIRAAVVGHGDVWSLSGTSGMPAVGPLSVTVPGAVAGWAQLLERWGTRSFGDLATRAICLARDGFVVSSKGAYLSGRASPRAEAVPGFLEHFGGMRTANQRFVQADLAATLLTIAEDGPDAVYRGAISERIVETLAAGGSTMTTDDLHAHQVCDVDTLRRVHRGLEIVQLPPPSQGVTALTALGILDAFGDLPADGAAATHVRIEAMRIALAERNRHLADPSIMTLGADDLLDADRIAAHAASIDVDRITSPVPGRPAPGGTAYVCALDGDGRGISLMQSNFLGFGSGVVVPGTGIALHNRGAHFSLDEHSPAAIGPGRRPMHTLIPAMALRDGALKLLFGTMGGDGQAQTHVQLLAGLEGEGDWDLADVLERPRWIVDTTDGSVSVESRMDASVVDGLRARGHVVQAIGPYDYAAGNANLIEVLASGCAGASDPRTEGAVLGR
ncbi:MAG: gamma-glutamyltransferase family protein [Nitriliruptoraceae bacterium]